MTALPNPLRGISYDSAYVASFMKQIPGPVLAVGHSYGGVINGPATDPLNLYEVKDVEGSIQVRA